MAGIIRGIAITKRSIPIPGASILVTDHTTGAVADLFEDAGLATPIANPITTDTRGKWRAFVDTGIYDITSTAGDDVVRDAYVRVP